MNSLRQADDFDGVDVAALVLFQPLPNSPIHTLGKWRGKEKPLGDHREVRGDRQKNRSPYISYCLADSMSPGDRKVAEEEVEEEVEEGEEGCR